MSVPAKPRPFSWEAVVPFVEDEGWTAQELGRRAAARGDAVSRSACLRRVARWKAAGLTVWEADRVATALGVHPEAIWGEAWWSIRPDLDEVFGGLRRRQRRLDAQAMAAARRRARVVEGYTAVERARERGPHRCAADGCCGARNAPRFVEGVAA